MFAARKAGNQLRIACGRKRHAVQDFFDLRVHVIAVRRVDDGRQFGMTLQQRMVARMLCHLPFQTLHFIHRSPGTTVSNLLSILGVTKQSLNRVLRSLIDDGLVRSEKGKVDARERHLHLTDKGQMLERDLSDAQRARMRAAYRAAGPQAVAGFRQVLEAMMDPEMRRQYNRLKEGG